MGGGRWEECSIVHCPVFLLSPGWPGLAVNWSLLSPGRDVTHYLVSSQTETQSQYGGVSSELSWPGTWHGTWSQAPHLPVK